MTEIYNIGNQYKDLPLQNDEVPSVFPTSWSLFICSGLMIIIAILVSDKKDKRNIDDIYSK